MFKDHESAGQQLAKALSSYQDDNPLVLAIPRGGVPVAVEVAKAFKADFDLLISRKLALPNNPEAGFGAIAEDGSVYLLPKAKVLLSEEKIAKIIDNQKKETDRRVRVLRGNRPLPDMTDRTVILVDDGIAVGGTLKAAIQLCHKNNPKKLIVAVPVASRQAPQEFAGLVDDLVIIDQPRFYTAVAQAYQHWRNVTDEEVIQTMAKYHQ